MRNDRFFEGNIYMVELNEDGKVKNCELYKKNAVLLKTKKGYYVDIEECDPVDIPYLYIEDQNFRDRLLMATEPCGELRWEKFVPKETIKPYISKTDSNTISLFGLRRELRRKNK